MFLFRMLQGTVIWTALLCPIAFSSGSFASGHCNEVWYHQNVLDESQSRVPPEKKSSYITKSISVRMYTHNIRYAADAAKREQNEQPWSVRRPYLTNDIIFNTMSPTESLICLQEVLETQLDDILTDMNQGNSTDEWGYIGRGRDYTMPDNEFGPIFYRKTVWQLEGNWTRWLSLTPEYPSKSWDAPLNRIITLGNFTHITTGIPLIASCSHLDNTNNDIRLNQSNVVVKAIENFTGITDGAVPFLPVFLGGDFNSQTSQSAYQNVNGPNSPMTDARYQVNESRWYGNNITYTSFDPHADNMTTIDFLFVGPKAMNYWNVSTSAVLANAFDDGTFESDHRAVISDAVLTYPCLDDGYVDEL